MVGRLTPPRSPQRDTNARSGAAARHLSRSGATAADQSRGESGATADGRKLRAERNRDAVVDALLALYDEGHLRPGAALLAERAGVSQSTVFRLFDDLDALVETAIDHQWARVRDRYRNPPTTGTTADRVGAIVRQRLALYEATGPALRGARLLAVDSPTLVAGFAARRDFLRRQVAHHFERELDRLDGDERRAYLDALDAATSLEHIEYLRYDRGLGHDRTSAALTADVTALLDAVRRSARRASRAKPTS